MFPTATACAAPREVSCNPSCNSGNDATPVGSPTVPTMQPALAQLAGPPASALASASSTTRLAPTNRSGVVVSFTGALVGLAIKYECATGASCHAVGARPTGRRLVGAL